jgi:hypothetical protein
MRRIRILEGTREIGSLLPSSDGALNVKLSGWKKDFDAREALKLSWEVLGPNTDRLLSMVQYSADGGKSWQVVHLSGRTAVSLPIRNLPGGPNCLVRVIVSDAFRTAFVQSRPFAVPSHDPVARIAGLPNVKVPPGQHVSLRGYAFDIEDGQLDGDLLVWSVDGAVPSATGREFIVRDLAAGRHRVTFTVTDREGRKSSSSVDLLVAAQERR